MKFIADENIDYPIIARLRRDGHDVYAVVESSAGISDDVVLSKANEQEVVLLTSDKDFGEMVYRDRRFTHGIILLRLAGLANEKKAEIVASVIQEHGGELAGSFTVVSPRGVRIRPRI
jgi:predicted nuclease of predicted toxin-antitoxin system